MINKLLIITIVCIAILIVSFIGCKENRTQIKIYPLSPATASGIMINPSIKDRSINDTLKYKTFIIEGTFDKDTTTVKKIIFDFIDSSQKDFVTTNTHCVIDFYKTSSKLNKNFKETHNDMLGGYTDDKIAELEWLNGKLNIIFLYKDSKLIGAGNYR